ncbi:hypothetical protein GLOTRDRAFT_137993 [Gloeophyllum trabeum ATCC 11539]|uniref:Yeast cell wall synthesis Kre9/Knh1-like N-terminal domain-containing protein n=1 Tax=Gloeophyllum trabeum (strain ATCC 11539 / FP-39264 / Madison 617) TaxID=670483 RepID=S7RSX4_GLOTA|nr:uncharacterized protein GLOTRDRAFT_137993 [Gloeophyllum trabeum ATCC 11539]EPQ56189.1 hypothetical protein GLOTRDRAFT_137993 [Gloeophyllum trabeum ATCC 11539]
MFTAFALTALFASSLVARADPTPNEPGPGSVFNEGSTCHIAWDPDTTGQWKNMAIELMTGDNFNMVHLTTVTTLDGTSTSTNTYDYPCPSVTPNAAIYFYQFSDPSSPNKTWTTRFAIADANGKTVDPSNASQPGGAAIPWGTGALTDPSSATPPPSGSTSSSNTSVPGSALPGAGSSSAGSGSTVVVSAPSGTTSASSKITTAKSAATNAAAPTSSGAAAGNKTATDGSADSGAAMVGGASGLKTAVVSLAVTALVFVVGL